MAEDTLLLLKCLQRQVKELEGMMSKTLRALAWANNGVKFDQLHHEFTQKCADTDIEACLRRLSERKNDSA